MAITFKKKDLDQSGQPVIPVSVDGTVQMVTPELKHHMDAMAEKANETPGDPDTVPGKSDPDSVLDDSYIDPVSDLCTESGAQGTIQGEEKGSDDLPDGDQPELTMGQTIDIQADLPGYDGIGIAMKPVMSALINLVALIEELNRTNTPILPGMVYVSPGPAHKGATCVVAESFIALTRDFSPYLYVRGLLVKKDGTIGNVENRRMTYLFTGKPVPTLLANNVRPTLEMFDE